MLIMKVIGYTVINRDVSSPHLHSEHQYIFTTYFSALNMEPIINSIYYMGFVAIYANLIYFKHTCYVRWVALITHKNICDSAKLTFASVL